MITVYYDGKCGLCSKEINHYKKISQDNVFNWLDIASYPHHLNNINVSQHHALLYLHALDKNNNLYIGVDAFILIWKNLKNWRILSIFISLPVIKQISDIIYKIFAKYRFSRYLHCQIALKEKN